MGYDRKDRQVNQPWVEEEEKLSACVLDISQTLLERTTCILLIHECFGNVFDEIDREVLGGKF